MKLSEIRESYERHSTSLSKINRQLIFAGIAIVWLFRVSNKDGSITMPEGLLYPTVCFIISGFFDIMQYFIQSLIWYVYYSVKRGRNKGKEEQNVYVNESELWNLPTWGFWILKVAILTIGYWKLAGYILRSLFPNSNTLIWDFISNIF